MTRFSLVLGVTLVALAACTSPQGGRPALLRVEPSVGSQSTLRWSPVEGAQEYRVYRSWWFFSPVLREAGVDQPFYQDSQLRTGVDYHYQVSAVVGGVEGPRSDVVTVHTPKLFISDLAVRLEGTTAVLDWTAVPGFAQYRITRETAGEVALPARFVVTIEGGRGHWVDPAPPAGAEVFYFIETAGEAADYSYGNLRPASVVVPGSVVEPVLTFAAPLPPSLGVAAVGSDQLVTWTGGGPGVSADIVRSSASGVETAVARGLVGSAWTDRQPTQPGTGYRVLLHTPQGDRRLGPVPAVASTPAPSSPSETKTLSVPLEGQPTQSVRWTSPGTQPWRGVVVFLGLDPTTLPRLMPEVLQAGWAVAAVGAFNFGTESRPRALSTKGDPGHVLLSIDLRRPQLSSSYLASAFEAAQKAWPQHPEVTRVPVAGWAFSQAGVSLALVLSRPEWKPRTAALVYANTLEPEVTMPLFELADVPQLFLLSGKADPYSQLLIGPGYLSSVNRRDLLQSLVGRWRMPLTMFTNQGETHGGGLDSLFAAQWLRDVLGQRVEGHLEPWQGRVGYTAAFETLHTTEAPWGSPVHPGVLLKVANPILGVPAAPFWTWFPSGENSQLWVKEQTIHPHS